MKLALKTRTPRIDWPVEGMTGGDSRFFSITPRSGEGREEEAAEGGIRFSTGGSALGLPFKGTRGGSSLSLREAKTAD
jgi:hypothetical protein